MLFCSTDFKKFRGHRTEQQFPKRKACVTEGEQEAIPVREVHLHRDIISR